MLVGATAASAGSATASTLPRRSPPIKPEHVIPTPDDDPRRIEVKFRDDLAIDLTALGPRSRGGGFSTEAIGRLDAIARTGGAWSRQTGADEPTIRRLRAIAQATLGREIANLDNYFVVELPAGASAPAWIDALNALPEVELASAVTRPSPPPSTPDYSPRQGYLDAAPNGIAARSAWSRPGGAGQGVTVCDLEYAWDLAHQDLPAVTEMIPGGSSPGDPLGSVDHGTAVLGEIVALADGMGVTGAAHGASAIVVPVFLDGARRLSVAITAAVARLRPGDVILIEQQVAGPRHAGRGPDDQFGLLPIEWIRSAYEAILTAVGNGIHVVEAAGNGGQDLDDPLYTVSPGDHAPFTPEHDSGAIIVGASDIPRAFGGVVADRSRLSGSNYGSRLDVQGWGFGVTTLGYGDLSNSAPDGSQSYTADFGGTSAASAMVAGAVAILEGEYRAATGAPLAPSILRARLVSAGTPQQSGRYPASQRIGPRPNVSGVDVAGLAAPPDFAMGAMTPNPMYRSVTIRLSLPNPATVRCTVFDPTGRRLATLADGSLGAGTHALSWNGRDREGNETASGVYFCRLSVDGREVTNRFVRIHPGGPGLSLESSVVGPR